MTPSDSQSKWVPVGRLARVRGNRGELIGEIYSTQPGRAERLREVRLQLETGAARLSRIERVWWHVARPVFKFEGLDSISDAEPWAGADILVREEERVKTGDGEYLHADLIGCTVLADQPVGVVRGVEEFGGTPLLRVESAGGREILIPFAKAICREIDVESKTIRAVLPEGLAEL